MNTKPEVFNAERQRNVEISNLLQRIKYRVEKLQGEEKCIFWPISAIKDGQHMYYENIVKQSLLKVFKDWGAIELLIERSTEEMNETLKETKSKGLIVEGALVKPIEPQFSQLCIKFEKLVASAASPATSDPPRFKFPHRLPAGTGWQNITIKFLNDEEVYIQVKQFKHSTDYKEMGFVGKGNNPNPSEAWTFLKVLASARLNGELTLKDPEARDKYKKQKELLAKSLQSYFSIEYDPFYPYRSSAEKQGNLYKIKITLIPPPEESSSKPDTQEEKDDLSVKEYFDEQTPQVYEDG